MSQATAQTYGTQVLTTLRFFAAVGVIIFHFGRETKSIAWAGDLLLSGHQMVTFFFVLSGFVLTLGYPKLQSQSLSFWKNRVLRIAPIYLIALMLCLPYLYGPDPQNGPLALLLSAVMIQAWVPNYALSLNRPGWSISVEVFFYALFPWFSRRSLKTLGLIAIAYWSLSQVLITYAFNHPEFQNYPSPDYNFLFYWPPTHLGSFLLGMWAAKIKLSKPQVRLGPPLAWFVLITLSLAFRTELEYLGQLRLPLDSALHAPLFAAFVLSLASSNSMIKTLLDRDAFLFLGAASYSLYILQRPLAMMFANGLGLRVQSHFFEYLLFCTSTSLLVYWVIEKPLRNSFRSPNQVETPRGTHSSSPKGPEQ